MSEDYTVLQGCPAFPSSYQSAQASESVPRWHKSDCAVHFPWSGIRKEKLDKKVVDLACERILDENWKCMHEWVDYIKNNCGENGLWQTGFQYGDWLALDKEESADRTGATDKYMIANAYYLYVTEFVKKTAEVPGKAEEAEKYGDLYETTLDAFQREYYTETGCIVSETQKGAILSLYFNLAREKDRKRILNTLLTNIANHKNHLAAGFEGTPYICQAYPNKFGKEHPVFMPLNYENGKFQ